MALVLGIFQIFVSFIPWKKNERRMKNPWSLSISKKLIYLRYVMLFMYIECNFFTNHITLRCPLKQSAVQEVFSIWASMKYFYFSIIDSAIWFQRNVRRSRLLKRRWKIIPDIDPVSVEQFGQDSPESWFSGVTSGQGTYKVYELHAKRYRI